MKFYKLRLLTILALFGQANLLFVSGCLALDALDGQAPVQYVAAPTKRPSSWGAVRRYIDAEKARKKNAQNPPELQEAHQLFRNQNPSSPQLKSRPLQTQEHMDRAAIIRRTFRELLDPKRPCAELYYENSREELARQGIFKTVRHNGKQRYELTAEGIELAILMINSPSPEEKE